MGVVGVARQAFNSSAATMQRDAVLFVKVRRWACSRCVVAKALDTPYFDQDVSMSFNCEIELTHDDQGARLRRQRSGEEVEYIAVKMKLRASSRKRDHLRSIPREFVVDDQIAG